MPNFLRFLCIAFAVLLISHAAMAPLIEDGFWWLLPIAIDGSLLWLLWAFCHRKPNTLSKLSTYCAAAAVLCIVFSAFTDVYGKWELMVQVQLLAEAAVCFALFIALRANSTKSWFNGTSAT